ncbi:FAD-dependent monooxygenase [Actinomadura litoris]|uniref:FAD-dependent oxidoreductase n=1 Tax=Actinomadura litoris TaxID=2678616 RepID=A0A7K1L4U3_9ACTN|nr:FAD-dependent monooxygenase [Actinomadura litoris]MUN39452.1 FAD-dependent oxidoreductase [Actinomadura litoris]
MEDWEDRVVIAGGGPTGLMLACELGLAGVEAVVVERDPEQDEDSQGMAVHGRSLEVFKRRGLADRIREEDIWAWPRTPFAFFWLDLGDLGEQDYTYAFPQWRTERLLEERARELGVDIRRGHELVGFEQDAAGVTVETRSAEGSDRLRGAFLVGCDGADSKVRDLAGIEFESSGLAYHGVLGDVVLSDGPQPEFTTGLFQRGMFGALPLQPGELRLMTIEFGARAPDRGTPVTAEELRASIGRVTGTDPEVEGVRWLSRFGGTTRHARRYREGRVLLAGDAAHVLYISGTQGLNAGIQDAVNLGWKLAAEVQGWAPDGLLDTYHGERHPVGERICMHARAQMALMHPLDQVTPLRALVGDLLEIDAVNRFLLELPSAAGYPLPAADGTQGEPHPLLGQPLPDVPLDTGGEPDGVAAALRYGRGVLLDLSDGAADLGEAGAWAGRVDVVTAKPLRELDAAVLLVRPDGHVAYADRTGGDPKDLRRALASWFGEPPSAGTAE